MKTFEPIWTDAAPKAIGTYSQAARTGDLVFISGQIPLDPESMELVSGEQPQIERAFDNLAAICQAAGGSLHGIVKLTIYLKDLDMFGAVNETMARRFTEPYPARAVIGVSHLPKGALIEVEAVLSLQK